MNGILVVNKPKGYTSRDIVNIISKKFNTKKVGHTGTLDPLAEGVLVVPIGRALKISELLAATTKEYEAEVILGYETDMLDITGKETKRNIPNTTKEEIEKVLKTFIGKSMQEVPMYSAVKIKGKKLYEYAREGIKVIPPKKEIEIYNIELVGEPQYLENIIEFKIKCSVSKGTYIRSLIRDIGYKLETFGTMKSLKRTRQGIFKLEESYRLEDIEKDNYKILKIREALPDIKITIIDDTTLKKVQNGMILPSFFDEELSLLVDSQDHEIAIYKKEDNMAKPYKMIEVNNE
ncbi:MAG: tRNA pseudouridine(55) synthase TruB [Bacilli bacterium]